MHAGIRARALVSDSRIKRGNITWAWLLGYDVGGWGKVQKQRKKNKKGVGEIGHYKTQGSPDMILFPISPLRCAETISCRLHRSLSLLQLHPVRNSTILCSVCICFWRRQHKGNSKMKRDTSVFGIRCPDIWISMKRVNFKLPSGFHQRNCPIS